MVTAGKYFLSLMLEGWVEDNYPSILAEWKAYRLRGQVGFWFWVEQNHPPIIDLFMEPGRKE